MPLLGETVPLATDDWSSIGTHSRAAPLQADQVPVTGLCVRAAPAVERWWWAGPAGRGGGSRTMSREAEGEASSGVSAPVLSSVSFLRREVPRAAVPGCPGILQTLLAVDS